MNTSPAETDFCFATALLEQGNREEGLQALSAILVKHEGWLQTAEGHPVYEAIQVQRAFCSYAPAEER